MVREKFIGIFKAQLPLVSDRDCMRHTRDSSSRGGVELALTRRADGKSVKKGKTFDTPHHAPASTGHKRKHEGGTHPKDLTRQSSPQQIPAAPPHKKTKRAKGSQYVDTLTGISAPEPPPHWGQQDQGTVSRSKLPMQSLTIYPDKAAVVNAYDASYGPSALPDHQLVDPPSRTRHNPKPSRLQREIDIERFTSGGKRASRATSNDEQQARAIAVPHGKMPKRAPTETAPAAPTAHAPTAVNKASASQKMSLKKKPTAGLHKPASQIEPARQVLLASNAPQAGLRRSPAEFGEIIKAYDADKWGPLLPNPPRYALDNIAKGLDPYLPPCPWCVNSGWNRDGWPLFNDPPNYRCPCGIIH